MKAKVHLITGGQRSGKSRYSQEMALELAPSPVYLATSRIWDQDFRERVERHQKERGPQWKNIEEEKFISRHDYSGNVVVLDCLTLWLTNFYFDHQEKTLDEIFEMVKKEFNQLLQQDFTLLAITNEIGMGGHPASEVQGKFTDLLGWLNQYVAGIAPEVTLMVSGIPVKIK